MNGTEVNKTPWQIRLNNKIIFTNIKKSAAVSMMTDRAFLLN